MKINKLLIGIIAILAGTTCIFAQTGTMTPYSRFGYGILSDNASASQQAMGGVGYAMNSGRQINVMNPASYARVDSLTFLFDMGLNLSQMWSSEVVDGKKTSEKNTGGGLSYITMQFPVGKRLGVSIGVLPFSSVGYAFGSSVDNGYTSRQGTGSINQLYAGVGAKLFKGLTLGVNMAYLFGSTVNDTYAYTNWGSTSIFQNELEVRDWRVNIGAQYTYTFGKNALTLGAVFTPGKALLGNLYTFTRDLSADNVATEISRTRTKDFYELPNTFGVGLNYSWDRRLMIELDGTYQPWENCKYDGSTGTLANRYKGALGVQYIPSLRGSFLKCIQYRAGGYFNRDYLMVRGNNVREYGASIGFGLPVPRFKTIVNLNFGWVHRQAYPSALIKEDYLNISIGINFNEMWFRQSKIY